MLPKRTLSVAAALALVTSGCQQDPVSPPAQGTPNFAASSGGVEVNVRLPVDLVVFVPCANGGAGELIALTGSLHTLLNILADGNGGFHVKVQNQPQGLSGSGLVTGDTYHGVGGSREQLNLKAGVTNTSVNNFRMIGQGPGNNYQVHENFHLTINANGDVTAAHDNLSVECK